MRRRYLHDVGRVCSSAFGALPVSRGLGVCLWWLLAGAAAAAPLPPIESFFRTPEFDDVALSPSGRYLAAITRLKQLPEGRNIVVFDVDDAAARAITGYDRNDVDWYLWVGDERIVFKLDRDDDAPVGQNMSLGIYSVQRDGKEGERLDDTQIPERRGRVLPPRLGGMREQVERIMGVDNPQTQLLLARRDDRAPMSEAYRLDLDKGGLTRIATNELGIRRWISDNAGHVRAAVGAPSEQRGLRQVLWYRNDESSDWKQVLEFDLQDLEVFGFASDDKHLLVVSRVGRERFVLVELDPVTGRFGQPLVDDPEYDVYYRGSTYLARTNDGRPLYYQYMADRPRTVFFDKTWRERQAAIDITLKDTVNTIIGWSDDERRFLIYAWSDREPGRYYLYEPAEKRMEELLSARSWIDAAALRPMQPIRLKARDGVTLHGYLTLPEKTEQPPPLVVFPHGGPFGVRDTWGFDPDVQFLASRGYAVLQIDYRGSGGYGRTYEQSGYHRWGLEMQDDITDAVAWTVAQGHVDAQRVCIYGAGYGGYAALMGLIKTPRLYRCGVDYGGPVDLALLYRTNVSGGNGTDDAARLWWGMTIGEPGESGARFFDTSPVLHVDQIRAPVLVIHGQLDERVQIEHYRRLVGELQKRNKPFEAMVKEHEGYGYHAEDNQVELYEKIEEFLGKYIAPRAAAAP